MACLRWPSSPLCPPGQRACAPLVEADVAGSHRALARAFDSALGSCRLSKSESPSPAIVRFFWRDSWTPALGMARRDWGAPWGRRYLRRGIGRCCQLVYLVDCQQARAETDRLAWCRADCRPCGAGDDDPGAHRESSCVASARFGRPGAAPPWVRCEVTERVTDDEIRILIADAESAGVIEPGERVMIAGVMRLGDRPARAIMTPRHDVDLVAS